MTEAELSKVTSTIEGLVQTYSDKLKEDSQANTLDLKSQLEGALIKYNTLEDQLREVKSSRMPYERETETKGLQMLREKSANFLANGRMGNPERMELLQKATVLPTSMINTSTRVIQESRKPGFIFEPDRTEHVRDFMSVEGTDSDLHTHTREESFNGSASLVAPDGATAYQKADFTLKTKNTQMFDLQFGLDIHKNILRDLPQVEAFISNRLTTKFYLKEDFYLMYGDGTAGNIEGFAINALAFSAGTRKVSNAQILDALIVAKLQNRVREYSTSIVMLSPDETTTIDLLKDTQGRYLDGKDRLPRIWESTLVTSGSFVVADAVRGASIIERSGLEMSISFDNKDNFEKGLVSFRLEKRLGLAKYYSNAFVTGTVDAAILALKPTV